ncbi:MAG: hypothetical protein IJQ17_07750 [Oscillospiraceae bacterium]|nr:hypothetical protein [Oscillospiraceae bacterium]
MSFFDRFLTALGIRKPEQAEQFTLPPAGVDPAEEVNSVPDAKAFSLAQKPVGVHEHSYIDLVIKPATCTTTGVKKCTCSECGAYRYATIPASHVRPESGIVTVEPTCVESGCETYTCAACGQEVIETIPATGVHTWVPDTMVSDATCTEPARVGSVCAMCGALNGELVSVGEPLGHDYTSEITVAATCTEPGVVTFTCSRCGDSYTETIPATGHTEGESKYIAPTCTESGKYVVCCSMCGEIIRQDDLNDMDPAVGHTYVGEVTKNPTCTEPGVLTQTCSCCGESYTEVIPPMGHSAGDSEYVAPTCTEPGRYITRCAVCGEVIIEDSLGEVDPALGHDYKAEVTEPTCVKGGYTTYTCARCGDTYVASETKPTGVHTPVPVLVMKAPTCQSAGIGRVVCKVCGEELGYGRIPALEHTWVTDSKGRCTCSQCGIEKND